MKDTYGEELEIAIVQDDMADTENQEHQQVPRQQLEFYDGDGLEPFDTLSY